MINGGENGYHHILDSFMPNFQILTDRPPLETALLSSKMTASNLIEFELRKCDRNIRLK